MRQISPQGQSLFFASRRRQKHLEKSRFDAGVNPILIICLLASMRPFSGMSEWLLLHSSLMPPCQEALRAALRLSFCATGRGPIPIKVKERLSARQGMACVTVGGSKALSRRTCVSVVWLESQAAPEKNSSRSLSLKSLRDLRDFALCSARA